MPRKKDFDDLDRQFGVRSHGNTVTGNPQLLETYGRELDLVLSTTPAHVWTLVEGDKGKLAVVAGYQTVDRVNHIITEKPWHTGKETFAY
jgi:hypothetical protein